MGNPFVHIELNTDDTVRAKRFYRALFDWKLEDAKMGDGSTYTVIGVGKGTGGGLMKKPPGAPTMWLSYVEVADVKKTMAKARKLGANVIVDFMDIPNVGAFGIFADPTGAALGVFQTKRRAPARRRTARAAAKKAPARKR